MILSRVQEFHGHLQVNPANIPFGGVVSPQPGGRSSNSSSAAGGGGVSPAGVAAGSGNMSPQLPRRSWGSRESYTSDGDSGVGAESTTSRLVSGAHEFVFWLGLRVIHLSAL